MVARSFAFEELNFKTCIFNVRKKNKSVLRYHIAYQAEVIDEDDLNFYFKLTKEAFTIQKNKLLKILGYD